MQNFQIASMMVCEMPKSKNGQYVISAYDGVWEPIERVPSDLEAYFTDEVGNNEVTYPGALQMVNATALDKLDDMDLYACFRSVEEHRLPSLSVSPPLEEYKMLSNKLTLLGWDVCSGNGWLSASAHGCYPFDAFSGSIANTDYPPVNKYSLLNNMKDSQFLCLENNRELTEHAPWYPVGVYISNRSLLRLSHNGFRN